MQLVILFIFVIVLLDCFNSRLNVYSTTIHHADQFLIFFCNKYYAVSPNLYILYSAVKIHVHEVHKPSTAIIFVHC